MLKVLPETAAITTRSEGALPDVSFVTRKNAPLAVMHLTRGSRPILHDTLRRAADAAAIQITGTVTVEAMSQEDLAPWRFHLVQFFMDVSNDAFYAGESSSEGSMHYDLSPPGSPLYNQYMLDADPADDDNFPFVDKGKPRIARVGQFPNLFTVSVSMTDHPYQDLLMKIQNFATGKPNYLYRAFRWIDVITVFVARNLDEGGEFKPLAYVGWSGVWNYTLKWTKNPSGFDIGLGQRIQAWFNVGQPGQGAPVEQRVAAMIKNPPTDLSDTYNSVARNQFRTQMYANASAGGVYATREWSNPVPPGTFK